MKFIASTNAVRVQTQAHIFTYTHISVHPSLCRDLQAKAKLMCFLLWGHLSKLNITEKKKISMSLLVPFLERASFVCHFQFHAGRKRRKSTDVDHVFDPKLGHHLCLCEISRRKMLRPTKSDNNNKINNRTNGDEKPCLGNYCQ